MRLCPDAFRVDPVRCAQELLGCELHFRNQVGVILETEAYREKGDEACHLFTRPSARKFASESSPGTSYVYLNYGVHWLLNVLCYDEVNQEHGFVLFRALAPVQGKKEMARRRGTEKLHQLCSGPGKLTQALGITDQQHGLDFSQDGELSIRARTSAPEILADRRVGISRDQDHLWRFLIRDHPGVSVPFGKA